MSLLDRLKVEFFANQERVWRECARCRKLVPSPRCFCVRCNRALNGDHRYYELHGGIE